MATVLPFTAPVPAPDGFAEALNGLGVGIVALDAVRRELASALAADAVAADTLRALVDEVYGAGRLAPDDYEILCADLGEPAGEDAPTDWSDDPSASPAAATVPSLPAATGAALAPGVVIRDRYVLQARVASGAMSEVFKALDRRRAEAGADKTCVAIKMVSPSTERFADALRLLQHEAALAPKLEHPHIARVLDFDRDGERAFITMEWLEGESLADLLTRLRNRPLSLPQARRILSDIGGALAYAHSRGIAHADVKPGNIFLGKTGGARLLDFGLARSVSSPQPAPAEARTPAYASCEVLEGRAPLPQDDVYSLACVGYRMLAGRRAFGHHDALAAESSGRRPAPIASLDGRQWAALERALAFRRAERTRDVATLLREFDAVTVPAVERGPPPAPAPRQPAWPRFARVGAIGAIGAAAAVLIGVGLALRDDAPTPFAAPAVATKVAAAPAAAPSPAPAVATALPVEQAATTGAATVAPAPATPPARAETPAAQPPPSKPRDTATAEPAPRPAPKPMPATQPTRVAAADAAAATLPPAGQAAAARSEAPAPRRQGATADTATVESGPKRVPLGELVFRRYVEPAVSSRSRDVELKGWVEVTFVVDREGMPRDMQVLDASPPGRFDRAALIAVKRWRFEPVREDGRPVERRTSVRLRFEPES